MAEITASMVKELRELTGLGMLECKKALVEYNGDLKAAEEQLRIKSGMPANEMTMAMSASSYSAPCANGPRMSNCTRPTCRMWTFRRMF